MVRLLFTTEDNSKQLTVITDGIDSQLNVFVTESVVGDKDYFESLGIVIEVGCTYNIGKFKEWAKEAKVILVSYPEGFNEQAQVLQDIKEEVRYVFTTSTPSLEFNAGGGQQNIVLTSTKQTYINDEPQGDPEIVAAIYQAVGEGFVVETNGKVSCSENPNDTVKTGSVICTQKETNKTLTVTLSQKPSTITYEYTFTVNPNTLSFAATGESKSVTVTSTKQKKLNGHDSGSAESVTFSSSVEGTGFSVNNTSITAAENTGEADRSGTAKFIQSESNKEVSVTLTQTKATISYKYDLTVSPTSLSFVAGGETKTLTVTSKKTKVVNGKDGDVTDVAYTTTVTGEGFSKGSDEKSIVAAANTATSERTGKATVAASEGGKSVDVTLTQAAAEATE